jgi:hypothetical protein
MKRLADVVAGLSPDQGTPIEPPLPHPVSSLADPPISIEEAKTAETAICRWHGSQYTHLNVEGRVYFCPIGGQLWRHSAKQSGMYALLRFKW